MRRGGQGEALAVWAVWVLTLLAVVVTYSRIDAAELYNVRGQRSRSRAQPRRGAHQLAVRARRDRARARGDEGPAAPRVVARRAGDRALRDDAAVRQPVAPQRALAEPRSRASASHSRSDWPSPRSGAPAPRSSRGSPGIPCDSSSRRSFSSCRCPGSPPSSASTCRATCSWAQELFRTADGQLEAAVHLGEHHGWHGSLLLLSALVLSRVQAGGRLRIWLLGRDGGARRLRRRQRHAGFLAGAARQARHRGLGDPERALSRSQAGDARHRSARRARGLAVDAREQAILRA